ncbi:hypothetical protein HDU82_006646 [Entophlyctis luteolus]|nr:hypothetical protein HDU82_006646 [Entophlyctis luteolus]
MHALVPALALALALAPATPVHAAATKAKPTTTAKATTAKAKTTTTAAAAAATTFSGNCVVTIPGTGNPLDPTTWTQPWRVSGCDQANGMGTICDITMFDTATNQLYAYVPLIVDAGSNNFVAPAAPNFFVPNANTVMYMGCGTNAVTTTLKDNKNGAGLAAANCTASGLVQYAGCNGSKFYAAVKSAIAAGTFTAPAVAVSPVNNRLCYSDFSCAMTDMDPQDNAPSIYLVSQNGKIAQQTNANLAMAEFTTAQGGTTVTIGSDMVVQNVVYDTALQCTDFKIPSAIDGLAMNTMGNTNVFGIANDLTGHPNRTCLAPLNGAFVTATGVYAVADTMPGSMAFTKVNELRALTGVDPFATVQAAAAAKFLAYSSDILFNAFHVVGMAPAMPVANNMATFLTQRFVASWAGLNCADANIGIGLAFPYTNFMSNANSGIVDGVTFTAKSATPANANNQQDVLNSAFFKLGQLCGITSNTVITTGVPKQCSAVSMMAQVAAIQSTITTAIKNKAGIQVTIDEPGTTAAQATTVATKVAASTTKVAAATATNKNNVATLTSANAAATTTFTVTVAKTVSLAVVYV